MVIEMKNDEDINTKLLHTLLTELINNRNIEIKVIIKNYEEESEKE